MTESKIELTERLRRENRWGEATRFKDTAVKDFRDKGMKRPEAAEAAWEAMAKAFPPLAVPAATDAPGGPDEDDELIDVDALVAKQPHDFARDVQWVYAHLADRNVKPEDAPTAGAWSLLIWARQYKNRFFEQVLPKAQSDTSNEEEQVKAEKKSIAEIRGIIQQMEEQADAELAADVPAAVRERVRAVLDDWGRRFGLTLPDGATAALAAHVALVHDCEESLGRASESV